MRIDTKNGMLILLGVILTVTAFIVMLAYNNTHNVERDKYYADHCKTVTSGYATPEFNNSQKYTCGVDK